MRKKIVAGNWKMNGSKQQIYNLTQEIEGLLAHSDGVDVIVFPPALYIPMMEELLLNKTIKMGAQNAYPEDNGAFTGELSLSMLREFDCKYLLVGHSERRHIFKEDEKIIAQKFHRAKEHDMIPVLCVGETLEERESGQTEHVISRQLLSVCNDSNDCFKNCIIAYEPVWAIGTGKTASPEQAQQVHRYIRALVASVNAEDAERLSILYGGSVNPANARALFSMPDIDGGLVGGASLNAKQFVDIVECIN